MYTYGLEYLNGFFHRNSIYRLQFIFNKLNVPVVKDAERIQLQHEFFSIVEYEKNQGRDPYSVSPNGMNYIYCIFDQGQYILLNQYGVTLLFQNWLIFDGELDVSNIQWIEKDSLVVFDMYYIVHSELQKCICHFSIDSSAFIYFTETKRIDCNAFLKDKTV